MVSIRKMISYCLITVCITISFFVSNSIFAEMITGPISTINALTSNIIQIHSSFADKITGAKNNTNISTETLFTATTLENNGFTLAHQWKNILQPTLYWRQRQIIEYNNVKLYNKLEVVKAQLDVQQQEKNPTLQFILIDLMNLQSDMIEFKDGFTEL
ncbi:hypothetical protein ACT7C7_29880 [Bacillus cereus]